MTVFKKFFATYKTAQYDRTAQRLLRFSDEELKQAGLSRKLLQQGGAAFPWRMAEVVSLEANDHAVASEWKMAS